MRAALAAGVLGAALLALIAGFTSVARGSIRLGAGGTDATLQVDAKGDVLVTWMQGTTKETVFVTAQGVLTRSGALTGRDVSHPVSIPSIPAAVVTRASAGGTFWALQRIALDGQSELDLSHWQGAPTTLTMTVAGDHLTGSARFDGEPVTGSSLTPGGKTPKIYVYVECYGCGGQQRWAPMLGVRPKSNGTFSVYIRPAWKGTQYRASLMGPNTATIYAPDAQIVIPS